MATLYHICPEQEWEQAQKQGEYRAPSLAAEGFIHCSARSQVAGTAALFFQGQRELMLLVIDRARVDARVQDDDIGNGKSFPHIYGPLNLNAVTQAWPFTPDANGIFALPP